jgi:hypothetical protein
LHKLAVQVWGREKQFLPASQQPSQQASKPIGKEAEIRVFHDQVFSVSGEYINITEYIVTKYMGGINFETVLYYFQVV